jgi:hypothetical protein
MATLKLFPTTRVKPENAYLNQYESNVTSQSGEDGIIEKIFEIMGVSNNWCVEFGAWDGKLNSNTWNLLQRENWSGILIEGNSAKFSDLWAEYQNNNKVIPVNSYVGISPDAHNALDTILGTYPIPKNFDFLSIDIDGCDWYVWETLTNYQPRLVVIEFNPTIPNHVYFIQDKDLSIQQGASLRALIELGKNKGYELVATNSWNAFFVCAEEFEKFNIADNTIDSIHDPSQYESVLFQLYDGKLVLAGYQHLFWHNMPITQEDIQILPEKLRFYDDATSNVDNTEIRCADLIILKQALSHYYADHQAYPISFGFDGLYTNWGEAKPDWISGLTPNYLYTLPREPSNTDQPDKQYLYRSNGQDYKLLCHGTEDCAHIAETTPELHRSSQKIIGLWLLDGGCIRLVISSTAAH